MRTLLVGFKTVHDIEWSHSRRVDCVLCTHGLAWHSVFIIQYHSKEITFGLVRIFLVQRKLQGAFCLFI